LDAYAAAKGAADPRYNNHDAETKFSADWRRLSEEAGQRLPEGPTKPYAASVITRASMRSVAMAECVQMILRDDGGAIRVPNRSEGRHRELDQSEGEGGAVEWHFTDRLYCGRCGTDFGTGDSAPWRWSQHRDSGAHVMMGTWNAEGQAGFETYNRRMNTAWRFCRKCWRPIWDTRYHCSTHRHRHANHYARKEQCRKFTSIEVSSTFPHTCYSNRCLC
jgi:hypothetical protein